MQNAPNPPIHASASGIRPLVRDLAAESLWFCGLTSPRRWASNRLSIVTFHRVLNEAQFAEYPISDIAVTCDEFDWFIRFFKQHFECGTLRDCLDRYQQDRGNHKPLLAITFDDGQLDNYENALPILNEHDLCATFYVTVSGVVTGGALWHDQVVFAMQGLIRQAPDKALAILNELEVDLDFGQETPGLCVERLKSRNTGERQAIITRMEDALGADGRPEWDGMMGADKLASLAATGHEIGSHTDSHAILIHCDESELEREIVDSRSRLEAVTGASIDSFCYPNGDYDPRVVNAVRKAGYRSAVTTAWGYNDHETDPLQLRRCDIHGTTTRTRNGIMSPARLGLRLSGLQPGL